MSTDLHKKVNSLYIHLELILNEVAVLKKELADSDVSDSSARKGVLTNQEKSAILQKRNKKKFNYSIQKDIK